VSQVDVEFELRNRRKHERDEVVQVFVRLAEVIPITAPACVCSKSNRLAEKHCDECV
jgi:hypothetical protein